MRIHNYGVASFFILLFSFPSLIAQNPEKQDPNLTGSRPLILYVRYTEPFALSGSMIDHEKKFNNELELLSGAGAIRPLSPPIPFVPNIPFLSRFREKPEDSFNFHFEFLASKSWGLLIGLQTFSFDFLGSPFAVPNYSTAGINSLPNAFPVSTRQTLYNSNLYHIGVKYHFLQEKSIDPYLSFRLGYGGYRSAIHRGVFQEISRFEPNDHLGTTLGISMGTGINLHFSPEIGFNIELEYWNLRNRSGGYDNLNLGLFQWQFGTFLKMQ